MKKIFPWLWMIPVTFLVGLDQATKQFFSVNRGDFQEKVVIPDFFYLTYLENRGASFSMFQNFRWGLVALTVIALVVMVVFFQKNKGFLVRLSLMLVIAGAVGNLIDRVRQGFVVDFLHFYPFGYDFPVFNVADICVDVGAALLIIWLLFFYHASEENHEKKSVQ